MRRAADTLALALALALLAGGAHAEDKSADKSKSGRDTLDQLRPTGPVTVKADRVEWVQNDMMKYIGNVTMTSDTLTVVGDSMDVKQSADGNFEAWIHGAPGTLDHAPQPGATGNMALPVHAEAKEIHYDSRSGSVDMNGNAHLKRGDDVVDGSTIGYVVPERRIRAAGGGNGQVTIIFQPPPQKKDAAASDGKKDGTP
ncbi:MAG: LptA/OstA family protein [Solimonas sp.]